MISTTPKTKVQTSSNQTGIAPFVGERSPSARMSSARKATSARLVSKSGGALLASSGNYEARELVDAWKGAERGGTY